MPGIRSSTLRHVHHSAGIVLAGGRSRRMGRTKAALPWRGTTLLAHIAQVLRHVVDGPVIIVGAPEQPLPVLPDGVVVVRDPVEGRGPLQGIATGLAAAGTTIAFVAATDMPLLRREFVTAVLAALDPEHDVALPVARGFPQPLAAAYRTALAPRVDALLAAGRFRPGELLAQVRVRRLDEAALLADPALAAADPGLDSLVNVNEPGEYTSLQQ